MVVIPWWLVMVIPLTSPFASSVGFLYVELDMYGSLHQFSDACCFLDLIVSIDSCFVFRLVHNRECTAWP